MTPKFTEAQLDEAADKAASGAIKGLPYPLGDFLTKSQISGLHRDLRAAVKTALLFDLMNHIQPGGCLTEGHEFVHEPHAEEGDPMTCIHCGAEYDDQ